MGIHQNEEVHVDHQVLRRDLRVILLLCALLFGAIVGLWVLESKIGFLAALANRGA
jgi:hypothetical protein